MKPAADIMREKIGNIKFSDPKFEIISNVTAKPEKDSNNIKKLLVDQIFSTVNWRESILNISKENVINYVEIGPGKVLTGMVKRTIKNSNCFSINSIEEIKDLKNEFKK
jgi:[acyl-carrier-protein] S-malonyltransferase